MGTGIRLLQESFQKCFGSNPGPQRYLDIGAQNLFGGTAEDYLKFIAYCTGNEAATASMKEVCEDLARRSVGTIVNQTTCKELFDLVGWEYVSIDMVDFATIKGDLNTFQIDQRYFGYFDFVANFGTTEHVFNQLNCFWNIHHATKVGGFMLHMLPSSGFFYHCLFGYNPKLFLLMAEANKYRVWHAGLRAQGSSSSLDDRHKSWAGYDGRQAATSPDVLVEFIFERQELTDFRLPYDLVGTDFNIGHEFEPPCSPLDVP
jgi:hypothetical protein